jgi:translocation and assembly module TamB
MSRASPEGRRRPSAAPVLGRLGTAIGCIVLFLVAVALAVVIHLDTPEAKAVARRVVNAVLAPSFQGRVVIDRVGRLGWFGLARADVTVRDAQGVAVIEAHGVSARVATLRAARSALSSAPAPLVIVVDWLRVERVDVLLDADASGQLRVASAFAPRSTAPSPPPPPNARGLRLEMPDIGVAHARAYRTAPSSPPIDVDLDRLAASLTVSPDAIDAELHRLAVTAHRIAGGADAHGTLVASVHGPRAKGAPLSAHADWTGQVAGSLDHRLHGSLEGKRVDAMFDAPSLTPDGVRAVWAGYGATEPAALHAEAHGELPDVKFILRAALGGSTLDVDGEGHVGDDKRVSVRLEARDVDAHAAAVSAPSTRLSFAGQLAASATAGGDAAARVDLRLLGGRVGSERLPAATIEGHAARTGAGEQSGSALVTVDDPSMPTRLAVEMPASRGKPAFDFDLRSDVPELDRTNAVGHNLRGSVHLTARGVVDLEHNQADARTHADVQALAVGSTHMGDATLDASARGTLNAPAIQATLRARDVLVAGKHLRVVDLSAAGAPLAPHVDATVLADQLPDVRATADLRFGAKFLARGVRLVLERAGERGSVRADEVSVGDGDARLEGLRIEGLGEPAVASASLSGATLRVQAKSKDLDLGRLGRLANLQPELKAGDLAFDADVDVGPEDARGHAQIDLEHGAIEGLEKVAVRLGLELDGRCAKGQLHGEAAALGSLDVDAPSVSMGGRAPLLRTSWREIWGTLAARGRIDLARAGALFPPDQMPYDEARGIVTFDAHFRRDDLRDVTPEARLKVATEGLAFSPWTPRHRDIDGVLVITRPPWRLAGVDFDLESALDGDACGLVMNTRARDHAGPLAALSVRAASLPCADVFAGGGHLAGDLRKVPIDAHLEVPERGLGGLPDLLKQPYVTGKLKANLELHGSIDAPHVELTAGLTDSHFQEQSTDERMNLDATAHYDGAAGAVSFKATSHGATQLDLESQIQAPVASFFDGAGPRWKASAKAHFADFPLEAVAVLNDKLVSGKLSGDVAVEDLHDSAKARSDLTIADFKVGRTEYKSARLDARADGRTLDGTVRIEQTDGFFQAQAKSPVLWGAALAPALAPDQPLEVSVDSQRFRVSILAPFVEGVLDKLDGLLDAHTSVKLDPAARTMTTVGTVGLSQGRIEAEAGGGEFHDISATLRFAPDGTITLEKLEASGVTGQLQANGSIRMKGTSLETARGAILIPPSKPLPISAAGTEIGAVDGRFEVVGAIGGSGVNVKVSVPHLRVALPEGSTTDAIALGPMKNVHLGAHRGDPGTFVVLPIDPAPKSPPPPPAADAGAAEPQASSLRIVTDLQDVEVTRGTQLKVELTGHVDVSAGATSTVEGQIFLKPGGKLYVQGKDFVVQNGTVTFVGPDPSNPQVVVKASWTAGDGTVVYANFAGPLKTGKVTLTSEPRLSQEAIVQLLLFGTPDGQQTQNPSASAGTSALGSVGGEAAQPLNHLFNQLGMGAVSVKVDTSQASAPRPEVAVQVARDISLQIAYVLGQPPPGVNPDHTLVTLDWRFATRWSLASTLGDAGTTIFDLLWRRRY